MFSQYAGIEMLRIRCGIAVSALSMRSERHHWKRHIAFQLAVLAVWAGTEHLRWQWQGDADPLWSVSRRMRHTDIVQLPCHMGPQSRLLAPIPARACSRPSIEQTFRGLLRAAAKARDGVPYRLRR